MGELVREGKVRFYGVSVESVMFVLNVANAWLKLPHKPTGDVSETTGAGGGVR